MSGDRTEAHADTIAAQDRLEIARKSIRICHAVAIDAAGLACADPGALRRSGRMIALGTTSADTSSRRWPPNMAQT
jgi:hypothetical protein